MSHTIAALIRDPDTGRLRQVAITVDGDRLRFELGATLPSTTRATSDISDTRAALIAALTGKDER